MQTVILGKFFHVHCEKLTVNLCLKFKNLIILVNLLLKHLLLVLFQDSYKKAREMLPMAEDTDGLDTEKETGRGMRKKKRNIFFDDTDEEEEEEKENHIQISKEKGKALPKPPKSNYKKHLQIRSSSSVRNALQRLKNQRAENKWRRIGTIDKRSDIEENMVDDNLEVPKKCGAEDINVELEKARKRIQERIKKARHEKETEAYVRENPGIIDKENGRPSDQYNMNVQLRSPDISLVTPPFIGKRYGIRNIFEICWCIMLLVIVTYEVDNTDDMTSVTTCQPRQRPVSALTLDSTTFSRSSSVASNQSDIFSHSSSVASNQSDTFSHSSSVASNKPLVTSLVSNARYHVQKILSGKYRSV